MLPARRTNWLPGIFNDFFGNEWVERQQVSSPAVNILENDKGYQVEIAAPGLTKKDFRIDVHDDNILLVTVEKKLQTEDKGNKYLRREFAHSSFCQSLILPDNVDKEAIKAKMEDGILDIEIPKIVKEEKAQAVRQIEIN
ncbi:MAG: Hsp20/alpha crystallin family protein [Bacteroidales bacterium]|jgi:HSP20 family protein|nr:Hsp20/alpha crystallin family protein [Bacteroidales bacterium]